VVEQIFNGLSSILGFSFVFIVLYSIVSATKLKQAFKLS
jgi:hypothetical protein